MANQIPKRRHFKQYVSIESCQKEWDIVNKDGVIAKKPQFIGNEACITNNLAYMQSSTFKGMDC
jgi:hypothetical protein